MTTTNGNAGKAASAGALRDIHVVEFGQYVPGPMLGMLLGDQGAHVIKVERPMAAIRPVPNRPSPPGTGASAPWFWI